MRVRTFVMLVVAVAAMALSSSAILGVDAKVKVVDSKPQTAEQKAAAARKAESVKKLAEYNLQKLRDNQAVTWPLGDKTDAESVAHVQCEACQMMTHVAMIKMWNHYNENEDATAAREVALDSVCSKEFADRFLYSDKVLLKACSKISQDGTSEWHRFLERAVNVSDPAKDREDKERSLTAPMYTMSDLWETERMRLTMCKNAEASKALGLCDPKTSMHLRRNAGLWEDDTKAKQAVEAKEKQKQQEEWQKKQDASKKQYRDRKKRAAAKRKAKKRKKYERDDEL